MSWYYSDDDIQEQREQLSRELAKRRKAGAKLVVLEAPGGNKKLIQNFWGQAWCQHLQTHADYEYRLPRGRSYLRQGKVYDLAIEPGVITAVVAGSYLYDVRVTIRQLSEESWSRLKAACAGQVGSLIDLLSGRLGDDVLRTVVDPECGLFPAPGEIKLSCTCPDSADLCKHVAAVLYGVGVKLDSAPELFFTLRSVDPAELLAKAAAETLEEASNSDNELAGEDLSALFGIELAPSEPVEARKELKPAELKPAVKKPAKRKASPRAKAPKPLRSGA